MKLSHATILTVIGTFMGLLFANANFKASPSSLVNLNYQLNFEKFMIQCAHFEESVTKLRANSVYDENIQTEFGKLRQSYKRVEFMVEYLHPQDVKDYINGAPLPKTERGVPEVVILQPKGLQVIEELVFAEDVAGNKAKLLKLSRELNGQIRLLAAYQKQQQLSDRQIFEAARFGILRIMSMGVTGFDTPTSGHALEESTTSLMAIFEALKPYLDLSKEENLTNDLESTFKEALAWMKENQNWENFDYAFFIREFVEPLYKDIRLLQVDLHVETMVEVIDSETPVNYKSDHIFDTEFLNPYYYTVVYKEMDNPGLTQLGKTLFFDPILSGDLNRSCASCHKPELGFTDGVAKSQGYKGSDHVLRNAPTLLNAIYSDKFFYDLRADKMDNQIEHVVFSEQEFRTNYQSIFYKLEQSEEYKALFKEAFRGSRNTSINRYTLSAAIASYIASLRSYDSPIDRYLRSETDNVDPEVIKGFNLFMGKAACATCHFPPSFSGLVPPLFEENETEVLGVFSAPDSLSIDPDLGRRASGRLSDEADIYQFSFKTPSIRNVALTAPYFHNGAYENLQQVVDFYNSGGAQGRNVSLPNQTLPADSLELTPSEVKSLIHFMQSLTDTSGTTSKPSRLPKFSENQVNKRAIGGTY